MARYVWTSDCHLDHLGADRQRLIEFAESLVIQNPTGIFITGDITTSKKLIYTLSAIEKVVQRPIFFVLGNHDFWEADTTQVRTAMKELTNVSPFIRYMPTVLYQALTPATAIVGADGWYDAGVGSWQNSGVAMVDWTAMGDFAQVNKNKATVVTACRKLAQEGVQHIHNGIKAAVRYHKSVIVLTHVPPFAQANTKDGQPGSSDSMPWYVNSMLGTMLMDASKAFPAVHFNVLCGHTHSAWNGSIAKNLEVHVAGATYGKPAAAGTIEVA